MTETEFNARVARLCQALGCGKELARDYVRAIGDEPVVEHGKIIVRDPAGKIIARVPASVIQD